MSYDLDEFRAKISEEIANCKYDDLQAKYGVNRFYLWHIIHDRKYTPPPKVLDKLGVQRFESAPVCTACGKVHAYDRACEKQVVLKEKRRPQKRQAHRFGWLLSFYSSDEVREMLR